MADDPLIIATAVIGAVSGICGTLLGVAGWLRDRRRGTVFLKVTPSHIVIPHPELVGLPCFGISVVNLSEVAVTLADVGFRLRGGRWASLCGAPVREDKGSLPLRLDPRAAYSAWFELAQVEMPWPEVRCAYARTDCGATARGTSKALRQLVRERVDHAV